MRLRKPPGCEQGKNDLAESCCKLALAIYEKAPNADPAGYVKVLEEYASVLRKTNRAAEAEKVEARARVIKEQVRKAGGERKQGADGGRTPALRARS